MFNNTSDLDSKYMAFTSVMLEEYTATEIAATMTVQALRLYKTILNDADYETMIEVIYSNRDKVRKID